MILTTDKSSLAESCNDSESKAFDDARFGLEAESAVAGAVVV